MNDQEIINDKIIEAILETCPDNDTEDSICVKDFYCDICQDKLELAKMVDRLARQDERGKIEEAIFPIYKGLISKVDAWAKSGDVLCEFIEQEIKKALEDSP